MNFILCKLFIIECVFNIQLCLSFSTEIGVHLPKAGLYVRVVFVPDCAGVLVSWTVPDSFIDNFFARHTAFRHTNGFRYVCSLNSYSLTLSSRTYRTVVVLRVMLNVGVER